jgi:hypothetical protein
MTVPRVDVASLGELALLGEGGEGRVFRASSRPGEVYKEFRRELLAELDPGALVTTISLLASMPDAARSVVKERTTWPRTVVTSGGQFCGFLMPELPDGASCVHGLQQSPSVRLCTWDLLAYRARTRSNPNLRSDTSTVDESHVLAVIHDLARLVEVLHRHSIVLGDISGRNILWYAKGEPRVMLIDCDGARVEGTRAVTKSKQSPDWIDPANLTATNLDSDRYKLALAVYRGYFSAETQKPSRENLPSESGELGREIHRLAVEAMEGTRPTAAEWVALLDRSLARRAWAGRPVLPLAPTVKAQPRQQRSPDRPVLPLGRVADGLAAGGGAIRQPANPHLETE